MPGEEALGRRPEFLRRQNGLFRGPMWENDNLPALIKSVNPFEPQCRYNLAKG